MATIPTDYDSARAALTRLLPLAMSDTGQARRVANFLMAWWNGPELGHFEIADLFGLDLAVANDITTVIGFLGQNDRGAVYIDSLGFGEEMQTSLRCGASRGRSRPADGFDGRAVGGTVPTAPKWRSSERRWRALLGRTAEEPRG